MYYDSLYFDEEAGRLRSHDFRSAPIFLVRARLPLNAREMLLEMFDQLPWRLTEREAVRALHWPRLEGDSAPEEFAAPWLAAPLAFGSPAEAAAAIPAGLTKAVKAFCPSKERPFLAVILPWLDEIWSPALEAALAGLFRSPETLARKRAFFLLGASPAFQRPFLEGLPGAPAETGRLSPSALYTREELRIIRAIGQTENPRRGRLWEMLGGSHALINAIWRELAAKGFIREADGRLEIDGAGILASIADIDPEVGCPDDLRIRNERVLAQRDRDRERWLAENP